MTTSEHDSSGQIQEIPPESKIFDQLSALTNTAISIGKKEIRADVPKNNLHIKFEIEEFDSDLPSIYLNSLPKSGTVYIRETLQHLLPLKERYIGAGYFPNGIIGELQIEGFGNGGHYSHNHLRPLPPNMKQLELHTDRMILHIRDPRQAILSWVHYQNLRFRKRPLETVALLYPEHDPNYFDWPLNMQIDYYIRNHMHYWVTWIKEWLDVVTSDKYNMRFLITQQKELLSAPESFFNNILEFYEIPKEKLKNTTLLPLVPGKNHYRKGSENEWLEVFNEEQIFYATSLIPEDISSHFGWYDINKIIT